jgi:hypothetical protein
MAVFVSPVLVAKGDQNPYPVRLAGRLVQVAPPLVVSSRYGRSGPYLIEVANPNEGVRKSRAGWAGIGLADRTAQAAPPSVVA